MGALPLLLELWMCCLLNSERNPYREITHGNIVLHGPTCTHFLRHLSSHRRKHTKLLFQKKRKEIHKTKRWPSWISVSLGAHYVWKAQPADEYPSVTFIKLSAATFNHQGKDAVNMLLMMTSWYPAWPRLFRSLVPVMFDYLFATIYILLQERDGIH